MEGEDFDWRRVSRTARRGRFALLAERSARRRACRRLKWGNYVVPTGVDRSKSRVGKEFVTEMILIERIFNGLNWILIDHRFVEVDKFIRSQYSVVLACLL